MGTGPDFFNEIAKLVENINNHIFKSKITLCIVIGIVVVCAVLLSLEIWKVIMVNASQ